MRGATTAPSTTTRYFGNGLAELIRNPIMPIGIGTAMTVVRAAASIRLPSVGQCTEYRVRDWPSGAMAMTAHKDCRHVESRWKG